MHTGIVSTVNVVYGTCFANYSIGLTIWILSIGGMHVGGLGIYRRPNIWITTFILLIADVVTKWIIEGVPSSWCIVYGRRPSHPAWRRTTEPLPLCCWLPMRRRRQCHPMTRDGATWASMQLFVALQQVAILYLASGSKLQHEQVREQEIYLLIL
jgi:hypothetical protein